MNINLSQELKKYLFNLNWLMAQRITQLAVSFFVSIYVINYLGSERFGIFSYVLSFSILFAPLIALGMGHIAVKEILEKKLQLNVIMGTLFRLHLAGAILFMLVLCLALLVADDGKQITTFIIIVGLTSFFKAFSVIDYFFQSRVLSKYIVIPGTVVFLLASATKLVFIYLSLGLDYFIYLHLIETIVYACTQMLSFYLYRKESYKQTFSFLLLFDLTYAKKILRHSLSLVVTDLSIGFGMRIDQVMLKQFINTEAVGIYAVGIKLAEPLSFIPAVLTHSVFPKIMEWHNSSNNRKIINFTRNVFYFLCLLALIFMFLGSELIALLFLDEYLDARTVNAVIIWALPFSFLNLITTKLLILDNNYKHIMWRQIALTLINIILNLIMIPRYGIISAAIATVVSDIIIGLFIDLFTPSTRKLFYLKIEALFFLKLRQGVAINKQPPTIITKTE